MGETSGSRQGTVSASRLRSALLGLLALFLPLVAHASPPGDLSGWLTQQDAALGAAAGTIVIDQGGRIEAPFTLQPNHSLELRAPVDWAATVRLAGGNAVQCVGAAVIIAHLPAYIMPQTTGMLLLVSGGSHIRVSGCHVTSDTESVLLAGYPVTDLEMTGNTLTGLGLLGVNGAARLTLSKNTLTSAKPGSKYVGIQLNSAKNVTVSANSFSNLVHGAMWWGGDSGAPGANLKQLTTTGQLSFIGNVCKNLGGSCIWGSMGYDVLMRGNSADGCGDVCFDTEGGLRTQIIANTALNCINGCAAVFFFTDQTVISGNHFHAQVPGGGLIFIKNSSQNPSTHDHMLIENNDLRCEPNPCQAVYQEAAGGIQFARNEVLNGIWLPVGYARSVSITNNHLVYTKALTGAAVALQAPAVIGGTALEVTGNRIESNVPQPAGSTCIAAAWSDFNATDTHVIAGNLCGGTSPFPIGLSTVSQGQNPGVAGVWIVSANRLGSAPIHHIAQTPNERYLDLGECGVTECYVNQQSIAAARALSGCSGSAPTVGTGSMAVCLGGVRGWDVVPLPR